MECWMSSRRWAQSFNSDTFNAAALAAVVEVAATAIDADSMGESSPTTAGKAESEAALYNGMGL